VTSYDDLAAGLDETDELDAFSRGMTIGARIRDGLDAKLCAWLDEDVIPALTALQRAGVKGAENPAYMLHGAAVLLAEAAQQFHDKAGRVDC